MSSFSVCAENVLIHNFFESDRLNSKYLFWNDTPYCLNKIDIRPENPVNKPFTGFFRAKK